LQRRFKTKFDRLVVTMLGGGVAAPRHAQMQAICAMTERRADTLHLIVLWPTATVEANAFNWSKTRIVRTHHASPLVAAADLFISAAGYNSFHEAMYNRVPTIFMAQMSPMMDDQHARATAAVDRGVAAMVEPNEMLVLDREITAFLDDGKSETLRAGLKALDLPQPGNAATARIIEKTMT
jgi:UDP:flavonoid glycosyltransferase YjiC (YdhE family)